MWLITNKQLPSQNNQIFSSIKFNFSTDQDIYQDPRSGIIVMVDGYVFPRHVISNNLPVNEMILNLYIKYGKELIHHVKGNFTIIILEEERFYVFSDHFAIKKFFYWQSGNKFMISNELFEFTKQLNLKASRDNMVIYTLAYHFAGGSTLFENIRHNMPAEYIEYKQEGLVISHYWNPEILINQPKKEFSITDISKLFSDSIQLTIERSNLDKISLSLTGGADTRNLLAVLLNKGIKPHLYTYGNPHSIDCVKASKISSGLRLNHNIYDIDMDSSLFEEYARKIIKISGGLASIHRAHRLLAIEKEKKYSDSMYLGTLGGEFIKGVSEDDYIVPSIVYENWDNVLEIDDLKKCFISKRLVINDEILNNVLEFLRDEPYLFGSLTIRKVNALSYITAHLHDAQDVNLYESVMSEVYTPFLDIDYLETLFSSYFTFDQKEQINNKFVRRINNPVYASKFLSVTYKPLTKFRYSGEHKPSEVLINKYYAAALKAIRKNVSRRYPPNFPLSNWMKQFVEAHLPICKDYKILRETYDLDKLLLDLKSEGHLPKEPYWLKFTNPIMMRFILEEFNA